MPKSKTVHVLSVRQPHADEIVFGNKVFENRSWRTRYRGELYIHASRWEPGDKESPGNGTVGAIIGKVILADCLEYLQTLQPLWRHLYGNMKKTPIPEHLRELHQLSEAEGWTQESFRHACGDFCFILTDRQPLKTPIPAKGRLNIWRFELPNN